MGFNKKWTLVARNDFGERGSWAGWPEENEGRGEMQIFFKNMVLSAGYGRRIAVVFCVNDMPNNLRIEPATLEDLPQLADLLMDLFSQERDFEPNRDKQMRGLQLILEQPNRGRIFVLRNESRIVAMINLLITISTAEGGFVLLLEDLVVRSDHRGQGYGGRLLEYAEEYARQKGFLRITLLTDKPNEKAQHFYLKHGYIESDMLPFRKYFRDSVAPAAPSAPAV